MKIKQIGNIVVLSFSVIIFSMVGCKNDAPATVLNLEAPTLVGTWNMYEAYKGEHRTKLLDNAYFEFQENGKMVTNILGDEKAYPYKTSNGKIIVESPDAQRYNVINKSSDTLIMTTRLRNFDFKFITLKSNPE